MLSLMFVAQVNSGTQIDGWIGCIIESEARAEASGMMVAVIVLMLVGVALSAMIWRLQAHLLRWQQHNMVE